MKTKQHGLTVRLKTAIFGLMAFAVALCGCATKLETGGAYAPGYVVIENGVTNVVATSAPDMALFTVDAARNLAFATLNAAFETEKKNRAFLWSVSPEIKRSLDRIRPAAKQAVIDYARARKAYFKNRTPAGLSVLQTILGRMQQLADAADTVVTKQKLNQ